MKDGFIRVAAATPNIQVANCDYNGNEIIRIIDELAKQSVKIIIFPELCITGYTCGDLFFQNNLINSAKEQLIKIIESTINKDIVAVVGLPFEYRGKLYNVAAVINNGKLLGLVPKINIPNYSEFYESRYFTAWNEKFVFIEWHKQGTSVIMGTETIFYCDTIPDLRLAIEICEDLWVPSPPSVNHVLHGATVIGNLSASSEIIGKADYRRMLVESQSARLLCGYIYADAGTGESTTDLVFGSHNIIAENGTILIESEKYKNEIIITELDLRKIISERVKMNTFPLKIDINNYMEVPFCLNNEALRLIRMFDRFPFVPSDKETRDKYCDEIITIQSMGLAKRLEHTNCKHIVIGISGGLDSTLALLVIVETFDKLGLNRENILAVTMPCFGTTDRTYHNAVNLIKELKVTLKEVNIKESVSQHFIDINHDINQHDITYENAQARMRTMILMNLANQNNGLVIGTGDLSELVLGWATYNGDHMSMYGVNSSIPKTLIRHIISYIAEITKDNSLNNVLADILETPVSPELLPPEEGRISQKTEDIVGPYELHDFYMYYCLRYGFEPSKIYRIAIETFIGIYDSNTIKKWLKIFYKRFISQQFKRSCLPDGPKVGVISVSPRGDLRMPSDASLNLWLKEVDVL